MATSHRARRLQRLWLLPALCCLAAPMHAWGAATLDVFSSDALMGALTQLRPGFERPAAATTVQISFSTTQSWLQRIEQGAPFDVAILTSSAVQQLKSEGRCAQTQNLARSGIGIAVLHGADKPDIASVAALEQALRQARAPAFTASGASGVYFEDLLKRLGLADAVNAKAKRPDSAQLPQLVERREVDLIVQQISELRMIPGIDYVGPLPAAVQHETKFSLCVNTRAIHAKAAQAWRRYLSGPAASAAFSASGLQAP